jgi:hypothetical protein
MNVVNVFDLMKAGRFVRHQECPFLKRPNPSSIVVLFSHRWDTLENPDPDTVQFHGAVRFVIQACMMASGSTPNVFNCVDFSELSLCGNLWSQLIAKCQTLSLSLKSPAGRHALLNDADLLENTTLLLEYLRKTIGDENTARVAMDASLVAHLMRDFDLWYDYTSMPQQPRSPDEQERFNRELALLHQYFSQHYAAILWSKSSLKRAWCFMEAAISFRSGRHSIFSTENSLVSSSSPAPIHERSFMEKFATSTASLEVQELDEGMYRMYRRDQGRADLTTDLTYQLGAAVNSASNALSGKSASQILSYLEERGYACTEEGDLEVVARSLAAHYREARGRNTGTESRP